MVKPAVPYEERMQAMDAAVRAAKPMEDMYVEVHYDDSMVVRDYKHNKFWQVGCTVAEDGTVTLGDWTEVEQAYVEVKKELRLLVPVQKANGARRITYGVVLEPDTEDLQGDVMKAEDIELSAHAWMAESQAGGEMHAAIVKDACVVESFLAPVDFEVETSGGSETVKKGSWVLAMRWPHEVWERIEKGELTGYSVGGQGVRIPLDEED
ncbi:MAG: XkdF-like putative serine protease domain-containing protein [Actinobacteria bacterium]|nr:XkdF-like putative serine protease domain-containing protein [Actinomycetota bacterium]